MKQVVVLLAILALMVLATGCASDGGSTPVTVLGSERLGQPVGSGSDAYPTLQDTGLDVSRLRVLVIDEYCRDNKRGLQDITRSGVLSEIDVISVTPVISGSGGCVQTVFVWYLAPPDDPNDILERAHFLLEHQPSK
jgi:hypothetical protein